MKLLMIGFNTVGKGTYWRVYYLGLQLTKLGHSVTIMVTSKQNRVNIHQHAVDGMTLVESPDLFKGPLRSGWDPWNTIQRLLWLTKNKFDLVHAFESRPTVIYPALFSTRSQKIPLVLDWADWFGHGGSVEERKNKMIRGTLRPVETFFEEHFRIQATGTTVICTTLRDKALELGIDPAKILLLPNGSAVGDIFPVPQDLARQRLGIPKDYFLIGYIGAIFPHDAELMSAAFNKVMDQIPRAHLLMIGSATTKDIFSSIPAEKIIQTGYVSQPQFNDYLAACDIFWLPLSDSNANRGRLPLKLNDYLAAGRSTVATAVGDVPNYFKEAGNGFLCQPAPDDLAEKTTCLYQSADLRKRMGEHARREAETIYSWQKMALQLDDFYKKIVDLL